MPDPAYATLTIALTFIVKFCVTITFFAVNLQCMETHPTCLRQTGISLGILLANIFGMLGPYIVYLVREKHHKHIILSAYYKIHIHRANTTIPNIHISFCSVCLQWERYAECSRSKRTCKSCPTRSKRQCTSERIR